MRFQIGLLVAFAFLLLIGLGFLIAKGKQSDPLQDAIAKTTTPMNTFSLSSPVFEQNEMIPPEYTCDGKGINPPLHISGTPDGTMSLALLVDDPDIPDSIKQSRQIEKFDHWVVFNMPASTTELREGENPPGIQGLNGAGRSVYLGPCPPDREHRYFFRLYALPEMLDLDHSASLDEVKAAIYKMGPVGVAELMGKYDRKR